MRKKTLKIVSLILIIAALLTNMAFAADTRASEYIGAYHATVTPMGNGELKISFDITAMGYMDSIGATKVDVYSLATGKVATFEYTDEGYEYMMGSDAVFYAKSVTYQGNVGEKYFAIVKFYAGDTTGGDTATYTTASKVA